MPDRIDEIKKLFNAGKTEEKLDYLFQAIHSIATQMQDGFKAGEKARAEIVSAMTKINTSLQTIDIGCHERMEDCASKFLDKKMKKDLISKKDARIFGIIILICALCFGLGAGYISFFELVKHSQKLLVP